MIEKSCRHKLAGRTSIVICLSFAPFKPKEKAYIFISKSLQGEALSFCVAQIHLYLPCNFLTVSQSTHGGEEALDLEESSAEL